MGVVRERANDSPTSKKKAQAGGRRRLRKPIRHSRSFDAPTRGGRSVRGRPLRASLQSSPGSNRRNGPPPEKEEVVEVHPATSEDAAASLVVDAEASSLATRNSLKEGQPGAFSAMAQAESSLAMKHVLMDDPGNSVEQPEAATTSPASAYEPAPLPETTELGSTQTNSKVISPQLVASFDVKTNVESSRLPGAESVRGPGAEADAYDDFSQQDSFDEENPADDDSAAAGCMPVSEGVSSGSIVSDDDVLVEARLVDDSSKGFLVVEAKPAQEVKDLKCQDMLKNPKVRWSFTGLICLMSAVVLAIILAFTLGGGGDNQEESGNAEQGGASNGAEGAHSPAAPEASKTYPPIKSGASPVLLDALGGGLLESTRVALTQPRHNSGPSSGCYSTPTWMNIHLTGYSKGDILDRIGLGGNNLDGSIPPELFLISSLQVLDLSANVALRGTLPSTIGLLDKLQFVYVDETGISGSIPTELGRATSLEAVVFFSIDSLSGTLPSELGLLTNLQELTIREVKLNGATIPSELGNLQNLTNLDLSVANLQGTLPSELGRLTNLEGLNLGSNKDLVGTIPTEYSRLTTLSQGGGLEVEITGLVGSIPPSLCLVVIATETNLTGC
ncbi:LRR receptor-like serine threonine-protein kinase [Seminavis robusta]|uniref:LRR receptor-like serine threonine-protein kinase n=1 Tax=Seminavis robusta TaxID=568900 RepID=A0A9N8H262_9STRA|nr:LRR receptor-like serine threonine-protein kinase [Seminavis robusta]|eukprot:Sro4_g003500.1 LRR receptor-like serine threonine-protein kinase (616) ;mRNA; f:171993-173959